jgi:GDP-mannose 6-dehydrogenase
LKVAIFGLGYVGSVSMACLAKNGHEVIGVDLNRGKVDLINNGTAPIIENGLSQIISDLRKSKIISATTEPSHAIESSDVSFICVGTPSTPNGHLDLSAVETVAEQIGMGIKKRRSFHTVAIRSTVLPGTNEKVSNIIAGISHMEPDKDFGVVSNPEFLREGCAIEDYMSPPYTLIGTTSHKSKQMLTEIYNDIEAPIIVTEPKIAELIKYVNNAFHALKITFTNEVANVCKMIGIDSHELMQLFCNDTRLNISPQYLKPGFAYGGSCLGKDLKALRTIFHDHYLECPVLESIEKSNETHKHLVLKRLLNFEKKRIGFLGLSFKAGTDDLRNSPIVDIIEILLGKGLQVLVFDRKVQFSTLLGANKEYILRKIPLIKDFVIDNPDQLVQNSDLIVVVNNDEEHADILARLAPDKVIFDLVNISFKNKNQKKNYVGLSW